MHEAEQRRVAPRKRAHHSPTHLSVQRCLVYSSGRRTKLDSSLGASSVWGSEGWSKVSDMAETVAVAPESASRAMPRIMLAAQFNSPRPNKLTSLMK